MIKAFSDYADYIDRKIVELFNEGVSPKDFPWDRLWLSFDEDHQTKIKKALRITSTDDVLTRFRKAYKKLHSEGSYGDYSDFHIRGLFSKYYDPFKALKALKGKQVANMITNMVTSAFINTLKQHTFQPNDDRDKLAKKAMREKVNELCASYPELVPVFKPSISIRDIWTIGLEHFSEEQSKEYQTLKKINISNGKIVAEPSKAMHLSKRATASFGAGVAAAERNEGQDKMIARKDKIKVNPRGADQRKPSDFS